MKINALMVNVRLAGHLCRYIRCSGQTMLTSHSITSHTHTHAGLRHTAALRNTTDCVINAPASYCTVKLSIDPRKAGQIVTHWVSELSATLENRENWMVPGRSVTGPQFPFESRSRRSDRHGR